MSRSGRVRWRRLLVLTVGIIGGVQIAYLVAANVLLRTGLLRAAINGPSAPFALGGSTSDLRLDYRSAYSWLPGRVHVEGLVMRGREETVEWRFSVDRVDVVISLPDLLRRTFHATRVRASGFAIQVRMRLEPADATPDVLAALPTIVGLADPPLLATGPVPPPLTDAKYIRAEYAKRDGREDGALLLDLGWIELGYDLAEGATGLVLLGPRSWFRRKVAIMRGVTRASERESDSRRLARYLAWSPTERQSEARELAAQCARARRTCDDNAIDSLLRASGDTDERGTLRGTIYAPLLEATAKRSSDGTALDPLVVVSLAEALKLGGGSTLDHLPITERAVAVSDADAARGKVLTVVGRMSSLRSEGSCLVGTLTTDAGPVYIVTPFAGDGGTGERARFRGVFVQWYGSPDPSTNQMPSLVLVGAFVR